MTLRVVALLLLPAIVFPQHLSQPAFDIGPANSCEVPQTTYCEGITYEVPVSIARLADFIEYEIRNIVDPPDGDISSCRDVAKDTLCRKKFPWCSAEQNRVFFERADNCEVRLKSDCAEQAEAFIGLGFCNYTVSELHSGSCRPLSSHDQSNELQHCSLLERDILVTDWMYEHIKQVDLKLQQDFLYFLGSRQPECWRLYSNFLCSAVGQCVGDRIHLINTQEMCEDIFDCYSDDSSSVLSDLLTCQPWPSQLRTAHTSSPTVLESDNPTVEQYTPGASSNRYGWVPSDRTFVFSSSIRTGPGYQTVFVVLLVNLLRFVYH